MAPSDNPAPLSAGSLSKIMASSLPKDASPQIKGPYDALALAVHAAMVAVRFRLVGLGEDHSIGMDRTIREAKMTYQLTISRIAGGGIDRTVAAAGLELLVDVFIPLCPRSIRHAVRGQDRKAGQQGCR
jgi:hypothetical protein